MSKLVVISLLAALGVACASSTAPNRPQDEKDQKSTAPTKSSSGGTPSPPAAPSGGPAASTDTSPTSPEEQKAEAEAEKCYNACIQTKGTKVKTFETCGAACKDEDEACWDGCWKTSGCEAAETECDTELTACEKQCGIENDEQDDKE